MLPNQQERPVPAGVGGYAAARAWPNGERKRRAEVVGQERRADTPWRASALLFLASIDVHIRVGSRAASHGTRRSFDRLRLCSSTAVPRSDAIRNWVWLLSLPRSCLAKRALGFPLPVSLLTWHLCRRSGSAQVVVMQAGPGGNAPQGAPQGGQWIQEKYCGLITWLVGIFIFPCVCCCPCDDRLVSARELCWSLDPSAESASSGDGGFFFWEGVR